MSDVEDIVAELADALADLVSAGELEVVSRRGPEALARLLFRELEEDPALDLADWLVERVEVTEVFLDDAELRERLGAVLARLSSSEADPAPRSDEALVAALERDPDDAGARLVYADWLTQHGDPRGELIGLQVARAKAPSDEELARREARLLAHHRTFFAGNLAELEGKVTYRLGFFDTAIVRTPAGLRELLGLESARLLRELHVVGAVVESMLATPLPPTLVALQLGSRGATSRLDVARATRGLARLERLVVSADRLVLTGLELPALRFLTIRHVSEEQLDALPKKLDGLDLVGSDRERAPEGPRAVRLRGEEPRIAGSLVELDELGAPVPADEDARYDDADE